MASISGGLLGTRRLRNDLLGPVTLLGINLEREARREFGIPASDYRWSKFRVLLLVTFSPTR